MTAISSLANPRIKQIRALRHRKERERTGLCYVDGLQLVAAAAEHGASIELLVISRPLLRSSGAAELTERLRVRIPSIEVTPDVFRSLAGREDTQGLGAVLRQRWLRLDQLACDDQRPLVALDGVQYPGNLGTILRTSDAAGGAGVLLLGPSADPYDPQAVRASTGAVFAQQLVRCSATDLAAWARARGAQIVGASPAARHDYREVRYSAPLVLAMGSEGHGLSDEMRGLCDLLVRIPMVGASDSLNLAIATGLMLYEALRQRMPISRV